MQSTPLTSKTGGTVLTVSSRGETSLKPPIKLQMPNKIPPYDPKLKKLARQLRQNMTLGEVLLWQEIRGKQLGIQFHRQVPILKYIVDFYCHELLLAIEIDGRSHDHPEVAVNDLERQNKIEDEGVQFLRFDETDVRKDIDGVVQVIEDWIVLNSSTFEGGKVTDP